MEKQIYLTVGTAPKYTRYSVETKAKLKPHNTHKIS